MRKKKNGGGGVGGRKRIWGRGKNRNMMEK